MAITTVFAGKEIERANGPSVAHEELYASICRFLAVKVARWAIKNREDRIFLLPTLSSMAGEQKRRRFTGTSNHALRLIRAV